jgi:hypothetical protein
MVVGRLVRAIGIVLVLFAWANLRTSAQAIKLVGADAQGALKFTVTTRNASFRIPIELQVEASESAKKPGAQQEGKTAGTEASKTGGGEPGTAINQDEKSATNDFRIVVDDFIAPDGRAIPASVTIDGQSVPNRMTIRQVDRPVLSVKADFPIAGDYKSNIVMFYGGKRAPSAPLIVTRQLASLSLRIDTADARAATVSQDGSASMHVVVQETAGQRVSIDPPALVGLVLKNGGKVQQEAPYRVLDLRLAGDNRVAPDAPCAEGEKAKPGKPAAPAEYTIEPLGHAEFFLTICGVSEAGEYNGIVRISNRETNPVDKAVTIYVKKSGWIAFLFIFLGVAASYLMRRWTKEEKPRLEAERRVGDLERRLKDIVTSVGTVQNKTEVEVLAALRDSLDKARTEVERGYLVTATATVDVVEKKIANLLSWHNAGRRLTAAEAAGNVATIRRDWEAMGDTYFTAGAPKDDFAAALSAILKAIDDASKARVVRDVAEFRKRVEGERTSRPEIAVDLDNAVKPLLDEASDHGEKARVVEADDALMRSKAAFASVLAKALILTLARPAPIGFTPQEWTAAGAILKPAGEDVQRKAASAATSADANETIKAYEKVNRQYLDKVLSAAETQVTALRADVKASSTIPPDQRTELEKQLDEAANTLKVGRAQLDNDDYNGATGRYQEATKIIVPISEKLQRGGGALAVGAGAAATPARLLAAIPASFAALPYDGDVAAPERPAIQLPERITDVIERYNLLLNLGVLLIATLLGMKLLWADDAVWGGWTAYTVAFLWGMGLQQVGGAGFEGLPALTKKLAE